MGNLFEKYQVILCSKVKFQYNVDPLLLLASAPCCDALLLWACVCITVCGLHTDCVLVLPYTKCCDCVSVAVLLALLFLWFAMLPRPCNAVMAHLIVSSEATNDMCHQTSAVLYTCTHTYTNTQAHNHYKCIATIIVVNILDSKKTSLTHLHCQWTL